MAVRSGVGIAVFGAVVTAVGVFIVGGVLVTGRSAGLGPIVGTLTVGVVIAAFGVGALVLGWRLARAPRAPVEVERPATPVDVPALDDLASLPTPFTACPRCGFLGVRMPELGEGLVAGSLPVGDWRSCSRCGYLGMPATFDSAEEYRRFVQDL